MIFWSNVSNLYSNLAGIEHRPRPYSCVIPVKTGICFLWNVS